MTAIHLMLIFAAAVIAADGASARCSAAVEHENVVEISRLGDVRVGSGVILTWDGYVLTAAHLLQNAEDIGRVSLVYHVRLSGENVWRPARLRKIDRVLDIALLKLDNYPPRASLVADVRRLPGERVPDFCLAGFGIDKASGGPIAGYRDMHVVSAQHLGEKLGYLTADIAVADGYSGGPAFLDGRLAGIILGRTHPSATLILPLEVIVDFVRPEGVQVGFGRSFEPGPSASDLLERVENNRRGIEANSIEIARILRSMEWALQIVDDGEAGLRLTIIGTRAFPGQVWTGIFYGKMIVEFDHADYDRYVESNEPIPVEIYLAIPEDRASASDYITTQIEAAFVKYIGAGLRLEDKSYRRLVITGQVGYGSPGLSSDILSVEYPE